MFLIIMGALKFLPQLVFDFLCASCSKTCGVHDLATAMVWRIWQSPESMKKSYTHAQSQSDH